MFNYTIFGNVKLKMIKRSATSAIKNGETLEWLESFEDPDERKIASKVLDEILRKMDTLTFCKEFLNS